VKKNNKRLIGKTTKKTILSRFDDWRESIHESSAVPVWMFRGLIITSLASISLLVVPENGLAESGLEIPDLLKTFINISRPLRDGVGNEFTGDATAWLFGVSSIPVVIHWISRIILRYIPIGESIKEVIRRINTFQRKYLMPFHFWLSIPALGFGVAHLTLSSCEGNILPEIGLILAGVLVATGLFFKLNLVPKSFRKALYQFHASLIVSGLLLAILLIGHDAVGLD
jgi:hypothetical protein